ALVQLRPEPRLWTTFQIRAIATERLVNFLYPRQARNSVPDAKPGFRNHRVRRFLWVPKGFRQPGRSPGEVLVYSTREQSLANHRRKTLDRDSSPAVSGCMG